MVDIKRYKNITVLLLIFLSIFITSLDVYADKTLVIDDANLMDTEEVLELNNRANALSEEFNMDIVIVSTDEAEGKSAKEYADDFFDYNGYGFGPNYDGILFLIDMDNREAYISTYGTGIRYLTDARKESVLDIIFDSGMAKEDYYGAAIGFLDGTEYYLKEGIPSGQYNEPEDRIKENKLTTTDVILALVGGVGAGGVFALSVKSQYKFKRKSNPYSYRSNSIVNFYNQEDKQINSFITHRIIPRTKPPSKSTLGRSTTHRSSSGRSHGGGGRKF